MKKLLLSFLVSLQLVLSTGAFAELSEDLQLVCSQWKSEAQSMEMKIESIDQDDFILNGGIPGLMFYGMVISPFLAGSDFLLGPKFREDLYKNHKDAVDMAMITSIPFVILPYILFENGRILINKVGVKKFLELKLSNLEQKIAEECSE